MSAPGMAPGTKPRKQYPFFLPMEGCPRRCSYCNQHSITGADTPSPEYVEQLLSRETSPVEVCYFGGSFTCLPAPRYQEYLRAFRKAPEGSLLRFSTHPLGISPAILESLEDIPLSMVELGVASLQAEVLDKNRRGYAPSRVLEAVELLLEREIPPGCQMMIGLPAQTREGSLEDLHLLARLGAPEKITLRLYPCLVLRHTLLESWMDRGEYVPLSLEEAVSWGSLWLEKALQLGFPVQRLGLCDTPSLHKDTLQGPLHPALGEQIRGRYLARKLLRENPRGPWELSPKYRSWLFGHGGAGIAWMARKKGCPPETIRENILWKD